MSLKSTSSASMTKTVRRPPLSPRASSAAMSSSPPSVGKRDKPADCTLDAALYDLELEKGLLLMEKGHRVCKLALGKRWEPTYRRMVFRRETRQVLLYKLTDLVPAANAAASNNTTTGAAAVLSNGLHHAASALLQQASSSSTSSLPTALPMSQIKNQAKPVAVDIRTIKDVHTLEYEINQMKVGDKWRRDKEIAQFDPNKILLMTFGSGFILSSWIVLFDTPESCRVWRNGIVYLMGETPKVPHPTLIERWLRKEFYGIMNNSTQKVAMKHMKPFVQTRLQYKINSRALQDLVEEEMNYDAFCGAYRNLVHVHSLWSSRFACYSDDGSTITLQNFISFLQQRQNASESETPSETVALFLRNYLKDIDLARNTEDPYLSVHEFCDYLFSHENSVWDTREQQNVYQDMDKPLSHYWIASSHNTYLTGDQFRSDSSLEAYARALTMGCRCIELDCWDGQKRGPGEADIIIYHGYTMTSKLNLRDVLNTIREFAFLTSDYPVILSIEDNCTVPSQRIMANDLRDILGDLLLTAPVNRDEQELPSPNQLKRKIILKHKKLPTENENVGVMSPPSASSFDDSWGDADLLSRRDFIKKGVLQRRDNDTGEWLRHVFVLFPDKLCYVKEQNVGSGRSGSDNAALRPLLGSPSSLSSVDAVSLAGSEMDATVDLDETAIGFGVRPEEMHVTEEWFHGKIARDAAVARLKENANFGNGVFLVRESTTFIGDFSLSFLYKGEVHHCRIKTRMFDGEKRYFFLEDRQMDTLYELISYYTKHSLSTAKFRIHLLSPCPQPSPHIGQPWFAGAIDKATAEEMLNAYREDGAFLIRYSTTDSNVFVLSLRVDGEIWHMRLKRDGRIFVVNQTVFETLNQIVEYYSTRELVRGINLKTPVNQELLDEFSARGELSYTPEGCYMELNSLDNKKDMLARARSAYQAKNENELSFPVNAVISIIRRDDGPMWRGKYGAKIGWFPSSHIVEIANDAPTTVEEIQDFETVELAGCLTQQYDTDDDHGFSFRVCQAKSHWGENHQLILAASTREDMMDWLNTIWENTRTANDKVSIIRIKEKDMRIASELSNLVVYCQAVPFVQARIPGNFYEMCSFSEAKHEKLVEKGLTAFNRQQLSRVYPMGSRLTSTNFNPMPMWNNGCHMVALNYQTTDRAMQLNQGRFMANGNCGYVLKPSYMMGPHYDADRLDMIRGNSPVTVTLEVIAGRHLSRKDRSRGIVSPAVEVEIVGLPADCQLFRTRTIASDGLHPVWNEQIEFNVECPELALIRFYVEDGDYVGPKTDPFIGQAVFPLDCIRTGYRSVPLRNAFGEELDLSSLLVHLELRRQNPTEQRYFDADTASTPHSETESNLCYRPAWPETRDRAMELEQEFEAAPIERGVDRSAFSAGSAYPSSSCPSTADTMSPRSMDDSPQAISLHDGSPLSSLVSKTTSLDGQIGVASRVSRTSSSRTTTTSGSYTDEVSSKKKSNGTLKKLFRFGSSLNRS